MSALDLQDRAGVADRLRGGSAPGEDLAEPFAGPGAGLRLTRLTLQGFKSFADKAEFTFEDPITGVVGPNGCGKSNLVDAIKWVLGERSSKSLRGKEMIDVIFAGSAGRKPGGMASVALTFENPVIDRVAGAEADRGLTSEQTDEPVEADGRGGEETGEVVLAERGRVPRPLPIDAEEVQVERQLFRDGTSRYLINGRRARLRDIRELFLDTGIGADAYSIIEQGKVDAMLLASPMDRRTILEEAAGIAKYKQRRIEATRKLDRTRQNLGRARDQLESTERRLRLVKGQAAKARLFQELEGELSAWRLALAFDEYDELRGRLHATATQLRSLDEAKNLAAERLALAEDARIDAESRLARAEGDRRRLSEEEASARHEAERAEQRRQMAERSAEDARAHAQQELGRVESERELAAELGSSIGSQRGEAVELDERGRAAEREAEEIAERRAEELERLGDARSALERATREAAEIDRERAAREAEATALRKQIAQLGERERISAERAGELDAARDDASREIESTLASILEISAAADEVRARLDAADGDAASLSGDRGRLAAALGELERELATLTSRWTTLEEMARERVGLGEAAKAALARRDAGDGFTGVVAPLAEAIETDAEFAPSVEAALGEDLDALLVGSWDERPTDDEIAALPGRVRLIPMRGETDDLGGVARDVAHLLGGRVRCLRDVVRVAPGADARSGSVLDRLLGSTLLVPDMASALLLAGGPLAGTDARLVTMAGDVLDARGVMTAGPVDGERGGGGVLSRAAELASLTQRIESLDTECARTRALVAAADDRAAALAAERTRLATELNGLETERARADTRLDQSKREAERAGREAATVREEASQLRGRRETSEAELAESTGRVESLAGLGEEKRAEAASARETVTRAERASEALADQLSAARREATRLSEQAAAASREASRLEGERERLERRAAEHARQAEISEARAAEHAAIAAQSSEEANAARARAAAATDQLAGASVEVDRARALKDQASGAYREVAADARTHEAAWNNAEMARRELEVRREHAEKQAHDELGLDIAGEYDEYREMMSAGGVARIDRDEAKPRIKSLRAEIKKLGNVNLDAIAEESQLAGRNEQLAAQVTDLDEAAVRLESLIAKLNDVSRELFGEAFGRIREHFGGQDGMFRKLFGGGRAEIRLMPLVKEIDGEKVQTDEVDLLDSGIEVIAKPPGKEPRAISQLSGGEKTLTAVALLMAIFRSKPSCFCVLDEVDAALDEANVGRFCGVVREFTDRSRFIVITHNKRTMQQADRLFGITQQERGVSKRVAVKFDQVKADGSIEAKAAREAERKEAGATR